jgi:hypothetical protein
VKSPSAYYLNLLISRPKRVDILLGKTRRANQPDLTATPDKIRKSEPHENIESAAEIAGCSIVTMRGAEAWNIKIPHEIVVAGAIAQSNLEI